jgi:biopolymer transport protein ExbD
MPKVKIARKSLFVDMTAMVDVSFLLLTFFILTSTFIQKEAVMVSIPGSISDRKVPDTNILNIIVSPDGRVFVGMDNQNTRREWLARIADSYSLEFTPKQYAEFGLINSFGVPVEALGAFLNMPSQARDSKENALGIPVADTLEGGVIDNQFKEWVRLAREVNPDITITIKADRGTPYPKIKSVMNTLQDVRENRYHLITSLESIPAGL